MKLVARNPRSSTIAEADSNVATLPSPAAAPAPVTSVPVPPIPADQAATVLPDPGAGSRGIAAGPRGLAVLAELAEMSHRENVSDLQIQAGKLVYVNRAGSTKAYEQYGKLTFDDVYQMLEALYRARTVFSGFDAGAEKDDLRERLMA